MDMPAKRYTDQLSRIKDTVRETHDSFKHNYDRFNEFRRFVFEQSLREEDITLLMGLGKPQLEFNVLEAYISRLLGEFSKQEPSIEVSAENPMNADPQMIKLVEMHLRHSLSDISNQHTKYELYKDILSGGFSVAKVKTDYASPMSFDHAITFERASDPTLCGFDPLARTSHKGDGRFCFELIPMEKQRFEDLYPDVSLEDLNFNRAFAGFNWSYLNDNTEMLLVCDFYEKKVKRIKIVQLVDGKVMTMDKYKELVDNWDQFVPPPAIMGKPRTTEKESIVRYRMIENLVLEYEETDYAFLPLVFFDGNSVLIKTPKNGNVRQVTRPYVYHAKGAQRLKNYAGISLANEIENTIQHKFMVAKESLPKEKEFQQAYMDIQKANVVVYNAYDELNPDKQLPPPREVVKVPAPPEIIQGFTGADSLIQQILGSYDASLGINDNQLSGTAIVEAATQSNAAAMPYIVGFMQGLQRVAQIMVDLFPKYYKTPRTIPVMDEEGKASYVVINQQNGQKFFYDENALNVKVEAGVNFRVQKSRALQQIVALQQASPMFQQFMATKGLPILLDNIEIRGIDQIKELAREWQQELQQQQAAQQQMQQQAMLMNPAIQKIQVDKQKVQNEAQKNQMQFQLDMQKLQQDEAKIIADLHTEREKAAVQMVKAETERFAKDVDLELKKHQHALNVHQHAWNMHKDHHAMTQPKETDRQVQ